MSNPLFNALGGGMPQLNQVQQMAGQFQHMLKGMK